MGAAAESGGQGGQGLSGFLAPIGAHWLEMVGIGGLTWLRRIADGLHHFLSYATRTHLRPSEAAYTQPLYI